MSNKTKPIVVIVAAVALAAGVAVYLSKASASNAPSKETKEESANNAAGISLGGGHIRGNPSAPVTLVEFGDYQCPSCGYYHPIVDELLRRYPDKVKLEFHHYPLVQLHAHALAAAMAVEAAGDQGKYWEMHDMIYDHQMEWSIQPNPEAQFLAYAAKLGLDANKFMQSVKSPDVENRIAADIKRGVEAKVDGTPTFYLNGRLLKPSPSGVDEFAMAVDAALQAPK